jgi:hypothetical protein
MTTTNSKDNTEAAIADDDDLVVAVAAVADNDDDDEDVVDDDDIAISKRVNNHNNNNNHHVTFTLPNNVTTKDQLALLPDQYLSNDKYRPLLLKVVSVSVSEGTGEGTEESYYYYMYALNPVTYSVLCILIIECLERLAYYGINNTETAFLDGRYVLVYLFVCLFVCYYCITVKVTFVFFFNCIL